MKKLLVFLTMFCFVMSVVSAAVPIAFTTSNLGIKGDGVAVISNENSVSGSNSAKLSAPFDNENGPEGRVRIDFPDEDVTLNDIISIEWMQYVVSGYASHVDVLIDTTGDGEADDALVFEWDKVTNEGPTPEVSSMTYARDEWIDTFDDRGIVSDSSYGWLSSEDAGPVGGEDYTAYTLADWKLGQTSNKNSKVIPADVRIVALEFEVDGWVVDSEAYIDDIKINDVLIEDFDDMNAEVDVIEDIRLSITPLTLDFGMMRGGEANAGDDIVFDATGSNVDVSVEVASVEGFPFADGLSLNGDDTPLGLTAFLECSPVDYICEYTPISWTTLLSIPVGTSSNMYSGTITYFVSGPAPQ